MRNLDQNAVYSWILKVSKLIRRESGTDVHFDRWMCSVCHMMVQTLFPFLFFRRDFGWYFSRYASCLALIAPRRFLTNQNTIMPQSNGYSKWKLYEVMTIEGYQMKCALTRVQCIAFDADMHRFKYSLTLRGKPPCSTFVLAMAQIYFYFSSRSRTTFVM